MGVGGKVPSRKALGPDRHKRHLEAVKRGRIANALAIVLALPFVRLASIYPRYGGRSVVGFALPPPRHAANELHKVVDLPSPPGVHVDDGQLWIVDTDMHALSPPRIFAFDLA